MIEEKKDRKTTNSAIGSWSGYIYQGLCAIYVVLTYIFDELQDEAKKETYKDYVFYLDSFNDFSIHGNNNVAVSLHQCKVYKNNTGFYDDQIQLLKQKEELQKISICDENTKLYFHANQKIDEVEGVIQYEFEDGQVTYGPVEIMDGIKKIVGELLEKTQTANPKDRVCNALYSLIDSQVEIIHQNYLDGNQKLSDLTRDKRYAIPFETIRKILFSDELESCQESEFWLLVKYNFVSTIQKLIEECQTLEDWEDKNPDYVIKLANSICVMKEKEFLDIIKRILPAEEKKTSTSTMMNIVNNSIVNGMLSVVGKSKKEISEHLDWHECGKYESPTAFSQTTIRSICKALYNQRNNLDCLREYDWLVHHQDLEKVNNCWDKILDIVKIDESNDDNSIFKEKKIGILSIEDFNNGNYD